MPRKDRFQQNQLLNDLGALLAWARQKENPLLNQTLSELGEKLKRQRFNLVVLGEFKRGKSTFLNALLGAPILPTAVVPLTSVITHITYGERMRIEVHFQNKERREIDPSELPAYITEKENPENKKEVEEVWLFYPALLLKEGVHLIDTPGVGSVYQHNTDVAYRFLPHVDGALFLLTADPPISQSELAFLKEIRQYAGKVLFLQNKIDLLDQSDREESLQFTRRALADALGGAPARLYPISAKWALAGKMEQNPEKLKSSLLPKVEQALETFLIKEKESVLLLSITQTLLRLIQQEEFTLSLQEASLNAPLGALPERQAAFSRQKELVLRKKTEASQLLDAETRALLSVLEDTIRGFTSNLAPRLNSEFDAQLSSFPEEGRKLREHLLNQIQEMIRSAFDPLRPAIEKRVAEEVSRITGSFSQRINLIGDQLMRLSAGLFGITFSPLEPAGGLTVKSQFSYYDLRLEPSFLKPLIDGVVNLLPSKRSRRIIVAEARRDLSRQIDLHAGRLRSDLHQRLESEIQQFRCSLENWVDQTEAQIEEAMRLAARVKEEGEKKLTAALHRVQEEIDFIHRMSNQLRALRETLS